MGLEVGTRIPELVETNPLGVDAVNLGDNHLRLIKTCILGSFPGFIGTTGTPKEVTLTEDQINDLAEKSAAAIISGAWQLTHLNPLQGQDDVGTPHELIEAFHDGTRNVSKFGNDTIRTRIEGSDAVDSLIAGVLVSRSIALAAGGLLVGDLNGAMQKVGFRSPNIRTVAGADTLVQADEGTIINCNGTFALDIPVLDAETTLTIKNIGVGTITLTQAGTTLRWLQGGAIATGNRSLLTGSVCQIQYVGTTTPDVWGNGLS